MEFISHSFRNAEVILDQREFVSQFQELTEIIANVSDDDLIARQEQYLDLKGEYAPKSLSTAINALLKERFEAANWHAESPIFQDATYRRGKNWRLDFAKQDISVEVAFNHGEAIAWNLSKLVLAAELNHVEKAVQSKIGVYITATQDMKDVGGFDGASGSFEKVLTYLKPLRTLLSAPILIIGLQPPRSFGIEHRIREGTVNTKYGVIDLIE
jgi:hypothetical protein